MKFLKPLDVRKFSRTNRYYFLFNVVLGLWTLFFFTFTRDNLVQQSFINMLFDKAIVMRISNTFEFGYECDAKIAAKNIVMLSLDDAAIKYLRHPNITPRNKIADMIRYAYEGGASVIVLDIALSNSDHSPASKMLGDSAPMTGQERDKELFNLLEKIKKDISSNTRVLIYTDQMGENNFSTLVDGRKIYLASPKLSASMDSNRKVRFWKPYSEINEYEDELDTRKILWSFQLLTLALVEGGEEELESITQNILHGSDEKFTMHCKSGKDFVFYREMFLDDDLVFRDTNSLQYNRIQYVFTPRVQGKWDQRTVDDTRVGHWRDNSLDNPKINFKDKVVIVGREDRDCDDFISTPIGRMPGMYVHGNAIATVLGKTQPHISPLWKYLLIEIILIVVTAYVFVYLQFSGAKRFVFILTAICGFSSYIYFCFTNEFVYLTCSFASMGIYNFVSRMEKFFKRRSYIRGWFRRKSNKEPVNLEK